MQRKFDTLFGRFIYNKRIAIVEPVFGNLKNKGMDRFTLRGKQKVNTQWQLFSLVHNIEKIAHVGAVVDAKTSEKTARSSANIVSGTVDETEMHIVHADKEEHAE